MNKPHRPGAINKARIGRRRQPHPFVPNPGTPELCAACNAGQDDLERGKYIHTI